MRISHSVTITIPLHLERNPQADKTNCGHTHVKRYLYPFFPRLRCLYPDAHVWVYIHRTGTHSCEKIHTCTHFPPGPDAYTQMPMYGYTQNRDPLMWKMLLHNWSCCVSPKEIEFSHVIFSAHIIFSQISVKDATWKIIYRNIKFRFKACLRTAFTFQRLPI